MESMQGAKDAYIIDFGVTHREIETNYIDPTGEVRRTTVLTKFKNDEAYQTSHLFYTYEEREAQLFSHAVESLVYMIWSLEGQGYKIAKIWKNDTDDREQGVTIRMDKLKG